MGARPAHRVTVLGAAAALLALAGEARAQEAVEVTASALNVRAGPGGGERELGQARRGQVYAVLGRSGAWVRLQFGAGAGWAHGDYLRASSAEVRAVTASSSLNVRTGPGTRYRDIGDLPRGARVAVSGASGAWRKIAFQGRDAWVHGDLLGAASSGGTTTPPRTPTPSRPRSRAGFIQLGAAGPGFYSYAPASRRWGTPTMVYGIERVAARWAREQPAAPRMGVGDISLQNGGDITGHVSHEKGVDVDVRPVRTSGEGAVTRFQSAYSRTRTAALIRLYRDELPVTLLLFNDTRIAGTQTWPNHDNHFHVRIRR